MRGKVCLSDTESAIQGTAQGLIKSTVNSFTYGVGGALISTGAALGKLLSYIELKENLKQLRSMSLSQFKDSEYRTH